MKKAGKIFLYVVIALVMIIGLFILFTYKADIPVETLKQKYANASSQFIEVKGMQVHFRDEGPASDSVPLVLLHGTSSFLQTWDACTKEWTRDHRVIRMDLPAFGLTGPDPNGDYSVEGYVSFLHAFLEKKDVKYCYLAGNSLGGLIVYAYAAAYPEQVRKLILVDPAGYPNLGAKGALAFKLGTTPVVKNLLTIVTPRSVIRKSLEDVYGNKNLVTDSLIDIYRDMTCREGNRGALLKRLNMNYAPDTTLVTKVHTRTLIIWGDQDNLIPVANAYKFHRDLSDDTLVIFKGLGHIPMEEAPGQVVPLVRDFISK